MSDIHMDLHRDGGVGFRDELSQFDPDVLMIAGDLHSHHRVIDQLRGLASEFKQVIFVPGNHEYWDTTMNEMDARLIDLEMATDNLVCSHQSLSEIDGQRFVCATMWFDFDDPTLQSVALTSQKYTYNDFGIIVDFYEDCKAGRLVKQRKFLEENVQEGDVVMTHHLPSFASIDPMYKNDPFNGFFVRDMEELILERKPKLWIHGHTHAHKDYNIGPTRVLCNPMGRPSEVLSVLSFKPNLVVEI
jgi:predicted phosphodiesterase